MDASYSAKELCISIASRLIYSCTWESWKSSNSLDLLSSLDFEAFLDLLLALLHVSRRLWTIEYLHNLFQ